MSIRSSEHRMIERIKEWTGSSLIGDDCALLDAPAGEKLLVSTDTLVEGTHFDLRTTSFNDLGWKSLAVNLSDIAAMGGYPTFAFISLGLPSGRAAALSEPRLEEFYEGMQSCARMWNVQIAGGDTFKAPQLIIGVTILGRAPECGALLRSGAKSGDLVIVTGDFGASRAGLSLLSSRLAEGTTTPVESASHCIERHRRPAPRLSESWLLAALGGALMDASDGLADALIQLSKASGVGMRIDLEKVPVHHETLAEARRVGSDPVDWMLYGGEDYELVGCIDERSWSRLVAESNSEHPFTVIGVVDDSGEVSLLANGTPGPELDLSRGYQHFEEG